MSVKARTYLVANIKLPPDASFNEAFLISEKKLHSLGINTINRKSIDARKKKDIKIVYTVRVAGELPSLDSLRYIPEGISELFESMPETVVGDEALKGDVVIVGSGPSGMFAGLYLAELGFNPIILERGGSVEEREKAIEAFKTFCILDKNTNIQFGAGGAGTFSDGKLVTRINDPLSGYVLTKLVEFGAPEEIIS